jgi:hypothetical protein
VIWFWVWVCLCDAFLTFDFYATFFVLKCCSLHSLSFYYGSLLVVIVCDQLITKYLHLWFLLLALGFFGSLGLGWGLGLGFVFGLCLCL